MLFYHARIFLENRFIDGAFETENGRFKAIFPGGGAEEVCRPGQSGTDLGGALVIPGLVDIHIHGSIGEDASDGDVQGLIRMGRFLAERGVTTFVPTTMTLPPAVLEQACQSVADARERRPSDCARIPGIHLEGPFLSEKKKGAQNASYLRNPDPDLFARLYEKSRNLIKIIDIAPELEGAADFAKENSRLCTISAAHTAADYETAAAFFDAGASHLTHLFNAMPPLHHRHPGVIGAAAERESVTAELICDGHHVHPGAVRMAFKLFAGRICLISDALRCTGMPDGAYELGGQMTQLSGGLARLADGTIAGSASTLADCLRKAVAFGIPAEDAIPAATIVPAKVIGCDDRIGSIEAGKCADFLVCDETMRVRQVYVGEKRIHLSVRDPHFLSGG